MLDATGVQDETDLGTADEPQESGWSDVLDENAAEEGAGADTAEDTQEAAADDSATDAVDDTTATAEEPEAVTEPPAGERLESVEHHLGCIHEARNRMRDAKLRWIDAKEAAGNAKKAYDTAVDDLAQTIDNGPERYPLFDQPPAAEAATEEAAPVAEEADAPAEDESWREVSLEEIGVPAGICEILAENPEKPIRTIGDVADWTTEEKHNADPLLLVPKVGVAKRDKIIECCDKFWADRNEAAAEPADGDVEVIWR